MDVMTIALWGVTGTAFAVSLKKSKEKTWGSIRMARGMMGGLIGEIVGILLAIGLLLTLIPPEAIKTVLGEGRPILTTVTAAIVGSITLIPAFVAFPLVGSLVDAGASIVPITAFLTTLTMVGFVTFPLEKKAFGLRFTLWRNGLSFVFAVLIALGMGVILL